MIFEEERYTLGGHEIVLRSAREDEAQMLLDYLRTVSAETRFLMCEPDEIKDDLGAEIDFIRRHNESPKNMLILAFVDGEYAGNCGFEGEKSSRRAWHRAGIGIALFLRFTGFGLGRLMLQTLIREMKKCGFEQAELIVVGGNDRAHHLYESLGFREYGRLPRANRYDDGTYSENILMVLDLR